MTIGYWRLFQLEEIFIYFDFECHIFLIGLIIFNKTEKKVLLIQCNEKDIILKVENISKQYRLGSCWNRNLSHDLNRWWHKIRGKEDPYLKIGDR